MAVPIMAPQVGLTLNGAEEQASTESSKIPMASDVVDAAPVLVPEVVPIPDQPKARAVEENQNMVPEVVPIPDQPKARAVEEYQNKVSTDINPTDPTDTLVPPAALPRLHEVGADSAELSQDARHKPSADSEPVEASPQPTPAVAPAVASE